MSYPRQLSSNIQFLFVFGLELQGVNVMSLHKLCGCYQCNSRLCNSYRHASIYWC